MSVIVYQDRFLLGPQVKKAHSDTDLCTTVRPVIGSMGPKYSDILWKKSLSLFTMSTRYYGTSLVDTTVRSFLRKKKCNEKRMQPNLCKIWTGSCMNISLCQDSQPCSSVCLSGIFAGFMRIEARPDFVPMQQWKHKIWIRLAQQTVQIVNFCHAYLQIS